MKQRVPHNFIQSYCDVEGCEKPHRARGVCSGHYAKAMRGIDVFEPTPAEQKLIDKERNRAVEIVESWLGEYYRPPTRLTWNQIESLKQRIKEG